MATHQDDLAAERLSVLSQLQAVTASFDAIVTATQDSNVDDEHDPEGATIAFERAQISAVADSLRQHLARIDAALTMVAAGTYGSCTSCHDQIGAERLAARPAATTCITCARLSPNASRR